MHLLRPHRTATTLGLLLLLAIAATGQVGPGPIRADEPVRERASLDLAGRYLDRVTTDWLRERKCAACHTGFPYLMTATALDGGQGETASKVRRFFDERVAAWDEGGKGKGYLEGDASTRETEGPTEVAALAATLAYDDRTAGKLRPVTRRALARLWELQREDGSWPWNKTNLAPQEHDDWYGTVYVAIGVGHAPESYATSAEAGPGIERMKAWLRKHPAPDLHHGLHLLWASLGLDGLMTAAEQARTKEAVLALQREDGGWNLPSLGAWKRRGGQPNDRNAPSDGYATGLVTMVLARSGVDVTSPPMRRAAEWLAANQRVSGRWYTRSLNRDRRHYISNAGTAYAAMALRACGYSERSARKPRARDLGIPFDGTPGRLNAIQDVKGVKVGHATVVDGEGAKAARTGVTAVLPSEDMRRMFAGSWVLNGNGEMTGLAFVNEWGYLISPIMLTNTISVGSVRDAVVKWSGTVNPADAVNLPIVAETWDGFLNDIYGFHVKDRHVFAALDGASATAVVEGNVGGGTGMTCHGFKGGIGTASRVVSKRAGGYTVGVLLQANHGQRSELRIAGVPVGHTITDLQRERGKAPKKSDDGNSVIVVVATDAPLIPHQLRRVARRAALGLARVGSIASTWSGDFVIAFSTTGLTGEKKDGVRGARVLDDVLIDAVFQATVQATEEAVVNALVAAKTMVGVRGNKVHAMPHDRVRDVLRRHDRLKE